MWWIILLSIMFFNALCTGIIAYLWMRHENANLDELDFDEPGMVFALFALYLFAPFVLVGILGYLAAKNVKR